MPNKPDRNEIYNAMIYKDTEELLQIWQENDHVSWHDEVFDVIKEILEAREETLPEQNDAVMHDSQRNSIKEKEKSILPESTDNSDILANENQPVFYNPQEVLLMSSKLKYIAYGLILSSFLSTLVVAPEYVKNLQISFGGNGITSFIIWVVVIIILLVVFAAQSVFIYYFLNLFGKILTILMEMEFTSREIME